jgi:hypothetical protein
MKAHLLILFFISNYCICYSQDVSKINELQDLSSQAVKEYVDKGNDLNEIVYGPNDSRETAFKVLAHSYGFYCDSTKKEVVFYMLEKSKKPITNPLFFLVDPCHQLASEIMEYFSMLVKYKHEVSERDFWPVAETYYQTKEVLGPDDLNYQNKRGKTLLMYAADFNYKATVDDLLNKKANINLTDKDGKTALIYACGNGNIPMIKLLVSRGANKKIADRSGKNALSYCNAKETKDALLKTKVSKK